MRIASTATNSSLGMPSLTQAKSSGSTFLAILAGVSEDEISVDESSGANTHADNQTESRTDSRKDDAGSESAAGDGVGRRISTAASGGQRKASDGVSLNARANRITVDYASSEVAIGSRGLALSDGVNGAPSVKAVVTASSSQPTAQTIPSSVVAQPTPISELAKPVSTRALMGTAIKPLANEPSPLKASAPKVSSSPSRPAAQTIQTSVVILPALMREPTKAVPARALMESATQPLINEPSPIKASEADNSGSPSQPAAQAIQSAVVDQPEPIGELAKPAPSRASIEMPARPLTNQPSPLIASAATVPFSLSQPAAQAIPSSVVVSPAPMRDPAKAVPIRALMESPTQSHTDEQSPLAASAAKVSVSPLQLAAQAIPSAVVVQPMPMSELANPVSVRTLRETPTRPLANEPNPPKVSATKVSVSSSQPSVEVSPAANPAPINSARALVDEPSRYRLINDGAMAHVAAPSVDISSTKNVAAPSSQIPAQDAHARETFQQALVNEPAQKLSGSGAIDTESKSNSGETNIPIPLANTVLTAPAKLVMQANSSPIPSQLSIASTQDQAPPGTSLNETHSTTQANEFTALTYSADTVPAPQAEFAVQTDSSRIPSQSSIASTQDQAPSGPSSNETGAKTHADGLTVYTSLANAVPNAPAQLIAQTGPSRLTTQSSFAAAPEQPASGASSTETDVKPHADEVTLPRFSVAEVSAASSQISTPPISNRQIIQRLFAGASDEEAPVVSSKETETKTQTGEPNVPVISRAASPSPPPLSTAQASSPGNPIQRTVANATRNEIPVSELKDPGPNANVETVAELPAAALGGNAPVKDSSSSGGVDATVSSPAVSQDKAQADESLDARENAAPKDSGSPAEPAGGEGRHFIPAALDLPARVIVSPAAAEISVPEESSKPLKSSSAATLRIPAAQTPATDTSPTNQDQKSKTVVPSGQTNMDTSFGALLADGIFTASLNRSTAGAPAENENGNQTVEGPVKKESSIAADSGNPAPANAEDSGIKQSTVTASKTGDGPAHGARNDLPSSQSAPADPSQTAEGAPKAAEVNTAQPSLAQAQAIVPQAPTPEAARPDRTVASSDTAPLPTERQLAPASIHGDGGEVLATSSINTAKLMQTMSESEMHIGMNSTEFGEISIRTSIAQQQMVAQISLDHSGLSQAISAHVSTMQAKLGEDYGLNASIEVHNLGSSHSGEPGQSPQREQKQSGNSAQTHSSSLPQPDETSLSLAAMAMPGSGDRLDIRA